jgi:hypothetical protein
MGPEHHEERLRRWARKFGRDRDVGENGGRKRVVVSIDYGKSPECTFSVLLLVEAGQHVLILVCSPIQILTPGRSRNASIPTSRSYNPRVRFLA